MDAFFADKVEIFVMPDRLRIDIGGRGSFSGAVFYRRRVAALLDQKPEQNRQKKQRHIQANHNESLAERRHGRQFLSAVIRMAGRLVAASGDLVVARLFAHLRHKKKGRPLWGRPSLSFSYD
jgi:hypothetical protein